MPKKEETISVRVTEQRRKEINEWADEHNLSEPDAVRRMINMALHEQQRLDEIKDDEVLLDTLQSIEAELKLLNKPAWKRVFKDDS